MGNLADFRAKYPGAYDHVDDKTLADAIYKRYYSTADRREFDARIGLTPYQNVSEATATAIGNLPASIAESKYNLGQMAAEAVTDVIDPTKQYGNTPPLQVTPGAPVEDLLTQPAGVTVPQPGLEQLLPEDVRRGIGEAAAKTSLSQQLRRMEASKALTPVDVAPGSLEEGVSSGIASAVEMVAPALASVAVRNPAPLVAYFTARSAGTGYGTARAAGAPTDTSRAAAGLYAAAEAVTEAVAGKVFVEGGKTLVRSVLKGIGVEGLTEAATEAFQALVDSGVIGIDMTLDEAMNRVKTAGTAGAIAGGVIAPITHAARGKGEEATPGITVVPPVEPPAVEDSLELPAPETLLALPPPEQFAPAPIARRQPGAPPRPEETTPPSEEEVDYQARVALQRTRQEETAALLQTARETVTPLGTFTKEEVGGDAAQRVATRRVQTGRPVEAPITIADLANAKVPQSQIDALIAQRRPLSTGEALTPLDIMRAADAKNIIPNDSNFRELAYRATGQRNVERMTQAQLGALRSTIDAMPVHEKPVTVPVADESPFTDDQYGKALDALRAQGRYTQQAIKDATGLKTAKDVNAVRDALVRRGQLVERGKGDYRLYDVLGAERQAVPDDLPSGAFKEHVVKRLPVSQLKVVQNGKSLGAFGSATEARSKIRQVREAEAAKGVRTPSALSIEPGKEVAYGVMENRYDESGNLLGQVVVDTHRDEAAAHKAADQLNTPDVGARYTATAVETPPRPEPVRRAPPPAAVAGRVDEIVRRLNKQAKERKLPLLGTRVALKSTIKTPEGESIEGMYQHSQKLISLTVEHLDASMSTDEIVEKLGQVIDHEVIHALRLSGVLAPDTDGWRTIMRYARRAKRPGTNETYLEWANHAYSGVPGYESADVREEEAIAEAFRYWAANRRNVTGKPATVFRQIVEWFKRLLEAVPQDLFEAIETGQLVEEALRPPGSAMPRARAADAMAAASAEVAAAQAAKDENLVRVKSREYLRARAQAREDRYGKSGPKTVLGTTPSRAYEAAPIMDRAGVAAIADKYRSEHGVATGRLMTLLPEDVSYLARVADAQQQAVHNPKANDVAKAYRALIDETRAMWQALGTIDVVPWNENGAPYASPEEMFADIDVGTLKMRLSAEMFGEGADNPGHPMYAPSGFKATDGTMLTNNDIFRVVHDVYGHGQSGFRDDPRGQYNAYHEHARLLSPEARRALATETLAQGAWANYGLHLRRRDGTVPRETDVDYLAPGKKEFAEQKAFLLPEELVGADPGWALAEKADTAVEEAPLRYSKFDNNLPGGRLYGNPNRSPGGALSKPGTPSPAFTNARPGDQYFGGELAEEQLRMVRTGERGATMIYMAPEDFLALSGEQVNPEQEVYDEAIAAGYKFAGLPSLVVDGYAGNVRATASDGAYIGAALSGNANTVPVVLYPRKQDNLGLVTALEGPDGARVPWPHEGRQENFPDERIDGGPRYSLNAPLGSRVPNDPPNGAFNIVQQRTEGMVGRALQAIGRSKRGLPIVGSIFDLRVKLQDKMLSIKEMIEDIRAQGGNVDDLNDTYMLEQLYHGKVFEQIKHREEGLQLPLLNALKSAYDGPSKITPKDFEDYLYARHAPERNAYLRARGAKLDNPSGMSDAEANTILDRFAIDGKLPEMETLARFADAITTDTTATRIAAGLISPDTESPYQHYVPLRGFAEEELDPGQPTIGQTRARSGKGFSVGGREDRTVTGRERKAGGILGHLFLQNTEAVIRGEKNAVAISFMRLLQENPDAGYGTILKTAPTRRVVGANGMIHEAGDPSYRQQPDIVTAKWKGQEIVARTVDPRLARAIKSDYVNTSNDLVNALERLGGKLNRYLATVNTSFNPEFLISNLARDMQTAGLLAAQYDIKGFAGKIIGNAPKAMLGIRQVLRDDNVNGPWAMAFREMQEAGGTTEFLGIHDLETQVARIRRSITVTGLAATPRKAAEYMGKVFKFVDDYNKVAENAFRLSAYVAAKEAGASTPQAAYLAKNLTVNFNKGGEMKGFMNAMYLFYNASMQGNMVLMNGLKNKRVQKLVAGVVVAGVLQDMLNRLISGDEDDNGVTDYDDIPEYVLETNFVLMDPLKILGDKGYFALPMPYGFNAFYNLGRNMSAGLIGQPLTRMIGKKTTVPKTPGGAMVSSLFGFVDAFNPLGGVQSLLNFVAPTFADPVVDVFTNTDYSGADIVPDRPMFGLPVPESQKYWSNTGDIPKDTAEWLNRATGGNEVRKGLVDVSPEILQYGFDYATGAMGKFLQRAASVGARTPDMLRGDFSDIEIGDIPFARRVVGSVTNRGNTERYYAVAREVKTVAEEIKLFEESGQIDALRSTVAAHPTEVRLIEAFEDGEKSLSDLRKQLRDLRENNAVPAARKREIERSIKEQQDRLMAQLNRLYFATKEQVR